MIKRTIVIGLITGATSVLAQTTPVPAPQTYPYPAYANTNQFGAGNPTFANGAGQNFTPEQLATQLQNLRSAIDQTLPMLSAFNQQYSNSAAGGKQSVRSEISGIVSDVFHRNQGANQNNAGRSSFSTSNLLSMLHGLLSTNSTSATAATPANAQDLIALQNDLQPVESILQRLNVTPNPTPMAAPYSQPYQGGNLSPTGR